MKSFVVASLFLTGGAVAQQNTTAASACTTTNSTTSSSSYGTSASAGTIGNLIQSQNSTTFSISGSSTAIGPSETTVSLFNACDGSSAECNYSGLTYYGGIVSANPTATVFAIQCASSNNATACADEAVTLTQGASVYQRVQTQTSPSAIISASCTIVGSTQQAVCVEIETASPLAVGTVTAASAFALATGSAIGFNANSVNGTQGPAVTTTMTFNPDDIFYNPLIITSGIEKLKTSATNTPVSPTVQPSTPTHKSGASSVTSLSLISVLTIVCGVISMFSV